MASTKTHIRFCPLPGAYGVAQLNVEATLKGLDDPTALKAAQDLGTAKCLVYLCTVRAMKSGRLQAVKLIDIKVSSAPLPAKPLVQIQDLPRRTRPATGRPQTLLNLRDVHPHLPLCQPSHQSSPRSARRSLPVLQLLPVVWPRHGAPGAGGDTRLHRVQ